MSITTVIVNNLLKTKLCAQNTHQKELERTTCTCFVLVETSPAAVFSCQSGLETMKIKTKCTKYAFTTIKKKKALKKIR
jgi:hypothetical protein